MRHLRFRRTGLSMRPCSFWGIKPTLSQMKQFRRVKKQMSIKKVYGAAIVQATASNPNGDPDNDGAPRKDINDYGMISPVAFKRRLRDSVARKSDAWEGVADELAITNKEDEDPFQIYMLKVRKS